MRQLQENGGLAATAEVKPYRVADGARRRGAIDQSTRAGPSRAGAGAENSGAEGQKDGGKQQTDRGRIVGRSGSLVRMAFSGGVLEGEGISEGQQTTGFSEGWKRWWWWWWAADVSMACAGTVRYVHAVGRVL